MANAINSLNYGNNTYTFTLPYGSCSTAAGTAAKTVTVDNFSLETGARVAVKFTVTNTAGSPTLNVNSTGAKAIYYKGAAITAGYLAANKVYEFIYNGTQWDLVGDVDTNTTYTALKNPNALTVKGNGTTSFSYDGSAAKTLNIKAGSNVSVASDTSGNITIGVPTAATDGSAAGVTVVWPAASCTTFSSDSGTVTPAAVQKGAKMFAITRPPKKGPGEGDTSVTVNAIPRWEDSTGDLKNSNIKIEDVTNTKDSSKKANVLVIPAEGGKKMVYGYCTDQTDGTSFIGGVFDNSATSYPYASGLAIGGTSGNLLWKGKQVATTDMIPTLSSLGGVPTSRTVNGKALSSNVTLSASDVGAASTTTYTATVSATWTADATNGGYYQTVTVSGMKATDNPVADVVLGSDVAANALYTEAWGLVTRITTAANSITLYANGSAPTTAFNIQLKVVR